MGQRLVVSVIENNVRIAALYFHWSAYTESAIYTASEIIKYLDRYDEESGEDKPDHKLALIRFAEQFGGGIDGGYGSTEFKYIFKLYPGVQFKTENISRNDGLIALSEEGMASLDSWSEGDLELNLDTRTVDNSVYWTAVDLDEFNEEHWGDDTDSYVPEESVYQMTEQNLNVFSFSEIDNVMEILERIDLWEDGCICYKIQ